MAAKFFLVLCASALLVQTIAAYPGGCSCDSWKSWDASTAGAIAAAEIAAATNIGGWGYAAPASIYTGPAVASASGGCFGVSVSSPFTPSGITVVSENTIDGVLEVVGSLPVLATVALEGDLPSSGAAGTSYSCGSGNIGISSESLAAAGVSAAIATAECTGYNAGARIARPKCGCGAY